MKKILFVILLFSMLNMTAQENQKNSLTVEALQSETNQTALLQKIKALENGSASDLFVLVQYYKKDVKKRNAITKQLNKKYPKSEQAGIARMTAFLDVSGAEDSEELLKAMIKDYPNSNLDAEKSLVAMAYAEVPDGAKVVEYTKAMENPVYRVAILTMSLELMKPIDINQALEIATKELPSTEKLKNESTLISPLNLDPKETYYAYVNMYGKVLFKVGKDKEAYKYTKEAYENIKEKDDEEKDTELIENYAFLSSSFDANYEMALPVLANAVKDGKNEKRYIDQVRAGYKKLNPEKDVEAYVASLQQGFIDKIKEQVKAMMINESAPDFYVVDVNGKKVSLADFKGKTIVLDFWATWCGPCVASFPAMQLAVNRYAADPEVKFLFIDTWETVKDPLTEAKQFLEKRKYNFDLYMDTIDSATKRPPAVTAFKVGGIPAKFIIDAQGMIRFKFEGFSGTNEAAAEELVQMVEMARIRK